VYVFEDMYRDRQTLTGEARKYLAETNGRYPNGQTQDLIPLVTMTPTARSRVPVAGTAEPFGPQRLPGKLD
jgi:hypothetical protein